MLGLVVAHAETAYPASTGNTGAAKSFPACTVAITTNSSETEATATVITGCLGGGFQFTSWIGVKTQTNPADLYDRTTIPNANAAYVVKLPPCVWQVDFVNTDPHLYAFLTGGSGSCTPTTTTTTTTVPPPTTTTTSTTAPQPSPTTTTTTLPVLPPPRQQFTTPTTLPEITAEQQQVQLAPGVTGGRG